MIKRILVALDPDEAAPTVPSETKSLRGGMYMTKTGKIIGIGGVGLLMTGYLLWARTTDRRETQRLWRRLEALPDQEVELFSEEMVADLPEPAWRYFLHAIAPGTPLARSVVLKMEGTIQLDPEGARLPMHARQVLAPPHGFVWEATVRQGVLRLAGVDYYAENEGGQRFRLWSLIPFLQADGADLSRSARGRLAIEAVMNPASLLPQRGVLWEAIDEESVRATLPIDGESFTLTLTVKPDGRLHSVVMERWGNQTETGRYASIPFGVGVLEERTFGGYTIPVRVHVGWWYGTDRYFDFFHSMIQRAEFR